MKTLFHLVWKSIFIIAACITLAACSRVTHENYDKVKPGMSMDEVVAILGKPVNSDSVNIAGVSGTSAVWRDKDVEIAIQFLNNQVTVKTFNSGNAQNSGNNDGEAG